MSNDEDGVAGEPVQPERLEIDEDGRDLVNPDDHLPKRLIALPLNQRPVFPTMMLPLVVPSGRMAQAVERAATKHDGYIGFFMTRSVMDDVTDFTGDDIHHVGCVARLVKAAPHEESGGTQILAQVVQRFAIDSIGRRKHFLMVTGHPIQTRVDRDDQQIRAYAMAIVTALKDLVEHNPVFADEIRMVLANFNNIDGPGRLADLAASLTTADRDELQVVLETFAVIPRMEKVLGLLANESEISQLKSRIREQINERVTEQQRKFFLNEQLKAIKEELGLETDEKSLQLSRLEEQFSGKRAAMSDEAIEATDEELRKLKVLDPSSSEYGVSRARLEWLLGMPWGEYSEDNLDLQSLRAGLDADHYGLDDIKKRIVEFCAVRRLKEDRGGGIICLAGPPGTGKTSIGQSIASQLGRKFFRFSVGGMRDEAEIKGHRRTYVGALPGKLAQALRRCGSMNPVILLDEIDKLGKGLQGDPASALLEVLDPEQNSDFLDHYLDIRIDLSQVLFVCTANELGGIPEPLRDRMEIIRLAGYIEDEKVAIASKYLVPKQRKAHGLTTKDIAINKAALRSLVRGYAREAGVRQLEQLIARITRKVATTKAEMDSAAERLRSRPGRKPKIQVFEKISIGTDQLEDYLGKPYLSDEELIGEPTAGVVTGLAWTAMGGATLEIECVAVASEKDSGGFKLSGQLGDVMKESAALARSYLRANRERFGVDDWFDHHLVHVHVPAGATPKDGPSAGITMATAMLSLALGKPVQSQLGMTGELTLTGRVYPIGGVREKIIAARRSGLKTVLLPHANERDYLELPDHLKKGLKTHFVSHIDEVLTVAGLVG